MKREVERHEWVIYEMSPEEFAEKIGIPERHIVQVSVSTGTVKIYAKPL